VQAKNLTSRRREDFQLHQHTQNPSVFNSFAAINSSTLGLRKPHRFVSTGSGAERRRLPPGSGTCVRALNRRKIRCLPQHNTLQNMNCYGFQAQQKCRFSEL